MHKITKSGHAASSSIHARGFSLIEIAISLAVLAVLLTGILVPVSSQIAQRKVAMTEKTLDEIRNALLGFAAANGRLPCPAIDNSTGVEAFATDIPAGTATNGRCHQNTIGTGAFVGFLPGRTLGITPVDSDGYVLDGWGTRHNRIRYAVSNELVTAAPYAAMFTGVDGVRTKTIPEVAKIASLLHVCDKGNGVQSGVSCNTAKTLTSTAVAVVWSVGANAATGGAGEDERENPNPNPNALAADRIFVSRTPGDLPNNPFDDVVTWLSFNTLVNRMVAAGQLP
jgi:prepilin-type N-terminal cleavage/methylation domain-containing protein